ncbi:gamma carbonic anhydrase family protein [Nitratireductor basaltis]|uniref:Acetyltransferase n=1 Tax=Nitratireductor basaltis TaxID=472175 RepID=A0A084UAR4_9HYPH|nr:gamma carbonic anhydrase family protein [Nitratireductor basaltis]KFB10050.1 Acetyltransferase [Nitratireductor basaltis]
MPIYEIDGKTPQFIERETNFIAQSAELIGNIEIGRDVSIWFGSTIRGDNEPIRIGAATNVQEHVVMHTDPGFPLEIGEGCTIGHRALLHGCKLGSNVLVGMGAIILNGADIPENCLVGAGALITEGKTFEPNSLIVGSPAKTVRSLDQAAIDGLRLSAKHYVANGRRFLKGLREAG